MSPEMVDLPSFLLSAQSIWLIILFTNFQKFANSLKKANGGGGEGGGQCWNQLVHKSFKTIIDHILPVQFPIPIKTHLDQIQV